MIQYKATNLTCKVSYCAQLSAR